jgi:hypothetical protein
MLGCAGVRPADSGCAQHDTSNRVGRQKKGTALRCSLSCAAYVRNYCDGLLCGAVWCTGAAVETGLPFLSSNTPSVMVIMNGLGV